MTVPNGSLINLLMSILNGDFMISQVENEEQLNICFDIIRSSFITVAEEFGITPNNCPSHTAFMTIDKLEKQFNDGRPMYLFYQDELPVGYFSLAKCSDNEWELNNLAVLPEYRHWSIGKSMVDYFTRFLPSLHPQIFVRLKTP